MERVRVAHEQREATGRVHEMTQRYPIGGFVLRGGRGNIRPTIVEDPIRSGATGVLYTGERVYGDRVLRCSDPIILAGIEVEPWKSERESASQMELVLRKDEALIGPQNDGCKRPRGAGGTPRIEPARLAIIHANSRHGHRISA